MCKIGSHLWIDENELLRMESRFMIFHLHEAGKGASELVYDIGTTFLVTGASEK